MRGVSHLLSCGKALAGYTFFEVKEVEAKVKVKYGIDLTPSYDSTSITLLFHLRVALAWFLTRGSFHIFVVVLLACRVALLLQAENWVYEFERFTDDYDD